ncbi:arginine--tRNA ligase [Paraferrimonas haliotis]|uniref:Arginine--tRNA ligase n=1 Tax=Paraferrimonas haliotis TaxID=2013866 RepID=A0AA37TSV0_9GAMM|nr:arginine--tRNA ligase [Paraferrimonas haliotis]GLS82300.1 arginine--tRNA ligase [Paraferrimonas haliotis]
MKQHILELLEQTLAILKSQGLIDNDFQPRLQVDRTKDKSHGDFATNVALMTAKAAKKPPRELAQLLIDTLPQSEHIAKVEIAGPGFINFFVDDNALANQIEAAYQSPNLAIAEEQPQTIVVDLSSPNLAKEMHVGHLRSSIIGDAVARTLEFQGHKVIRQNHVGDWGTQFGMLLAYMEEKRAANEEISMALSDLESFYRAAKQRFDESPEFANRARDLVVELQSGNEQCLALWREFNEISLAHCQSVYDKLNVKLTRADVRGESAYNDDLTQVVADLDAAGVLTEDQGAKCVFLDEFKNQQGDPLPVIVQKKGGGFLYSTTDLAAMRYRQNVLHADRVLYFVDQRQGLHFQQVFTVARKAGFVSNSTSLEHLGFGTMNGEDGKPFKTRSGDTVKLIDLLVEAEQRAMELVKQKNTELSQQELETIANAVGIGSVKYADLSKNRSSDYIFSFDQMLSFEGNTAPYLLYALTRVSNIARKANDQSINYQDAAIVLAEQKEIDLANKLAQFAETIKRVADRGTPHVLCGYLFELAGTFSSFYEACPVLSADTEAQRNSRLKLAKVTERTLKTGLDLLGIETLERM